jgi:hypothetical protein
MRPSPTTVPTESLANPLIQLPHTTLEPSPAIVSLTNPELPISTHTTFATLSDGEMPEPAKMPSRPDPVAQADPAIAPQTLQSQTKGLPDQQPYVLPTQNLSQPTISGLTPSIAEFSTTLVSQAALAESLKEHSLPIESPDILRWLTPTIQERNQERDVEMPLPEPQRREIYSEVKALPIASVSQEDSDKRNTIHIGAIDIQIMPATVVPTAIGPSPAKSGSTTPLARSFSSSFGLRQG